MDGAFAYPPYKFMMCSSGKAQAATLRISETKVFCRSDKRKPPSDNLPLLQRPRQKLLQARAFRIAEQLVRRALFFNAALVQENHVA